jgi:hypothetical protein
MCLRSEIINFITPCICLRKFQPSAIVLKGMKALKEQCPIVASILCGDFRMRAESEH